MPQIAEEGNKSSHTTDSPRSIAVWWHKFHFSGRVIMCSVLFGLGLILIGGLVFAINVDSDSTKSVSGDDKQNPDQLPMKAPSNYVGPVVMGIGGFIVIVGVIMCLFETQVCRKKTGDSRPLISGRTEDPEGKVSDPTAVPSHGHKNHRHKTRKTSSSPRKSKNRQKISSSKSPPVSIDKSKGFMTSSEEKFLTPPNTLDEHAALIHTNTRDTESQSSTSLMKSFTSSGPSWNQSTEYQTPSTSFKDASVSIDNSVEIDEKEGQVNFKTNELSEKDYMNPEYMTPLTVEEDRIQKLFIRVKNEQKEMAKREMDEKVSTIKFNSRSENEDTNPSQTMINAVKEDIEIRKSAENIRIPTNELPSIALPDTLVPKDNKGQSAEVHTDELQENKNRNEENSVSDKISSKNEVHGECPVAVNNNEIGNELSHMNIHTGQKEKTPMQIDEKQNSSPEPDYPTSPMNEAKHDSSLNLDTQASNGKINENDMQVDLENSASSDETVVSRDSSVEKAKDNGIVEKTKSSMAKENTSSESKILNISESPDVKSTTTDNSISSNHQTPPPETLKGENSGAGDLSHCESDTKEEKNNAKVSAESSS